MENNSWYSIYYNNLFVSKGWTMNEMIDGTHEIYNSR